MASGLSAAGRGPLDDGAEALGGAWKSLSPGPAAFVLLQVASVNVGVIAVDPARVEEARVALALARREGASVVLALVAGAMEDAKRLVAAVPGVDFALVRSSQSAQVVPERVGNTAVFEVGSLGEHVGVLELVLPRPGAAIEDGEPGRDALVIANVRLERARE